jgi:tetratricopeptide (TPR) repeat protein
MIHRSTYLLIPIVAIAFFSCSGSPDSNSGDSAFNKGDYSSAVTSYTESLQTNPSDIDLLYGRGRAFQELGKFIEAQADFEQALNLDAKNFQVLLSLATIQLEQKSYASALLYATKAEEIPGAPARASFLKGRALHQLGMPEDALKAYGNAIQVDKNFGQAYLNRGLLKIGLDRTKQACEDFKLAAALNYPGAAENLEKYCK